MRAVVGLGIMNEGKHLGYMLLCIYLLNDGSCGV